MVDAFSVPMLQGAARAPSCGMPHHESCSRCEREKRSAKNAQRRNSGHIPRYICVHFRENKDASKQEAMMQALWAGDTEAASASMSDLLWKTISDMDYHEGYYHAFMAGWFVDRGNETKSDKE